MERANKLEVEKKVGKWLGLVPGDTDFVIQFENFQIPCHKVVLRKSSCYFEALFASHMKEADSNILSLKDTEARGLLLLLDFAYTGRLDINEENMFQLASFSSMYQFTTALDLCQNFITNKISSQTWMDILSFSEIYQLGKVHSAALRYILWHFPQEMKASVDKFKELPKELLSKILGHPLLNCFSEVDVVHVLDQWEQSNSECTNNDYMQLFKSVVYFGDMTCQELESVIKCASVQKSKELSQILEETTGMRESNDSDCGEKMKISSNTGTACRRGPLLMLCVGGDESQEETTLPSKCIYQVDPLSAKVQTFGSLDKLFPAIQTKMGYRACTVGTDLYIMGGEAALGRNKFLMDMWRYSSFDNTWHPSTSLTKPRRHHGIAVLGDAIFLIGGIGRYREILTSVESYNTVTDEWLSLSPLRTAEFWPAVTVCRGEIYLVKNSQQKYSPITDQWTTLIIDLPNNLGFHSAVCLHDSIFMKCHYDGRMVRLDTVQGMKAETVATFSSAPNGQLLAWKDRIYCFGGDDCSELQYYDVKSGQMRTVGKMELSVIGASLVVLPHYPKQL